MEMIDTVKKSDLERIVHNCSMTAHYAIIFRELMEVYEPDVEMTLADMERPFIRKTFTCKIPGTMDKSKDEVRYSDYIRPLFFTAYLCRITGSNNEHIIKELLGRILRSHGHFHATEEQEEGYFDMTGEPYEYRKAYWGVVNLSTDDQDLVTRMHQTFMQMVMRGA